MPQSKAHRQRISRGPQTPRTVARRLLPLFFTVLVGLLSGAGASPAPAATPALSVGVSEHQCALRYDGAVLCWGRNRYGQLGTNTNLGSSTGVPTPAVVPLGEPATEVVTGFEHTCVLLASGAVKCFGRNASGQLGNPTNSGTDDPTVVPALVGPLDGTPVEVSAGENHTCVRLSTGAIRCFGLNFYGQLGSLTNVNTTTPTPAPTPVSVGAVAAEIDAGGGSTCARLVDGAVRCWGQNDEGQVGRTINAVANPTPLPTAPALTNVAQVSVGRYQACAALNDGGVRCFGGNDWGQLGSGTIGVDNAVPTAISPLGQAATQVVTGGGHTCTLLASAAVSCFGYNVEGALGRGDTVGSVTTTPGLTLPLGGPVRQVSAGRRHTCALRTDGTVVCFGQNASFQLGVDIGGFSYTPIEIPNLNLNAPLAPPPPPPPPVGPASVTDADKDGVSPPADCNDANAAIKPGAREVLGNKIDENCDGKASPFPRLGAVASLTWQRLASGRTRITGLRVDRLSSGSTITLSCKGKGCRKKASRKLALTKKNQKTAKLNRYVAGLTLRSGAVLEVRISRPGFQARIYRYTMIKRRNPRKLTRCLSPGAKQSVAC